MPASRPTENGRGGTRRLPATPIVLSLAMLINVAVAPLEAQTTPSSKSEKPNSIGGFGEASRGDIPKGTIELMTADHLGAIPGSPDLLPPGFGFGLGFAVRRERGMAVTPGSVGLYYWSGLAGTTFWVDPAERLFAVFMMQGPAQREYYRGLVRDMVYAAIVD